MDFEIKFLCPGQKCGKCRRMVTQVEKAAGISGIVGLTKDESDNTVFETMISALHTMFKSNLAQPDVFDLIPVKPIGDKEEEIMNIYDQKLKGLYTKLTS